jgi:hypothetical protein
LNELKTVAEKAMWFADAYGLVPQKLTLKSAATNDEHVITLVDEERNVRYENLFDIEKTKIQDLLYILDNFFISDAAYHELVMTNSTGLPSKHLILQCRNSLSTMFTIHRCPGGVPGAYVY